MTVSLHDRIRRIGELLIDQDRARVAVPPQRPESGYWFGGGNLMQDQAGTFWLVGRYRNAGDSRTGVGAGERGLELAVFTSSDFTSSDRAHSFEKMLSFGKGDLSVGDREVLSIEGTALRLTEAGVELYVSSEKTAIGYPPGLEGFLKPGTGIWTIDRMRAASIDQLKQARIETVLESGDPRFVHIKDPFLGSHKNEPCLLFCTHPFCWTSSNTGFVSLAHDSHFTEHANFGFFPRGTCWDVAITRGTAVLPLPRVGILADRDIKLMFYDGGECVRDLDPHAAAVKRPRGYSCEELGGLAFYENDDLSTVERVSIVQPLFVSPHGTGCSRYVDVLATQDHYIATWQQAQQDGSQPLVINSVAREEVERILTGSSLS